ncbi:hypothetical protein L596_024747 [Steinernema carpocapsae]|uniref:Uncharacterized protein n=1 Tax=Steinernema carpocapsae TaxID=34508 RepID=A0A4U5M5N4_STECR|nr:hypothetical protein L596_024747 [Steinernema carpocapsae]
MWIYFKFRVSGNGSLQISGDTRAASLLAKRLRFDFATYFSWFFERTIPPTIPLSSRLVACDHQFLVATGRERQLATVACRASRELYKGLKGHLNDQLGQGIRVRIKVFR